MREKSVEIQVARSDSSKGKMQNNREIIRVRRGNRINKVSTS